MKRIVALLIAFCIAIPFAVTAGANGIDIFGAIEVETGFVEEGGVKGEDITTATVALGFDAQVAEQVEAHVILLFEEDGTNPVNVDEAFIVLKPTEQFFVLAGTYVVPFGSYGGMLISDPLTTAIGETGQTAVTLGLNTGPFTVQAGTFNGDIMETGETEEKINVYFASADYAKEYDSGVTVTAGASYISSLADSDGLEGAVVGSTVDSFVAGYSAYLNIGFGSFTFIAEYLTAADEFKAADFGTSEDIKPQAYNLELGMDVNEKTTVAVRYGGSKDMDTVLFETVMAAAVSYELYENTTIAAEYLTGSYKDSTDIDDTTALVFQLAVGF